MPPKKVRKDLKSTAYLKSQAQVWREETHCWICGQPVDFNAKPRSANARSTDHVVSPKDGGHPDARSNLRLAHVSCNSRKGRGRHVKVPKRARLL